LGGAIVPLEQTGPGSTVRELVAEMVARWPGLRPEMVDEQGNLLQRIQIMVNGRNIRYLNGLDTVLADTSSVAIFPPVGGG
jgi:molybdopterin synthase sulfur carrier subunit